MRVEAQAELAQTSMSEPREFRKRRQRLTILLWICVIVGTAGLAFGYFLPQDLRDTSQPYLFFAALSFVARVLTFHLAMALIVASTVAALILRRKYFAILAGASGVIALLPTI